MGYYVQALALTPSLPTVPIPLRLSRLLDAYGPLLTSRQREACHLHFDEDWSFSEVASHMGVTRSGAHDLVHRAVIQAEEYELRLGLVELVEKLEQQIAELQDGRRAEKGPSGRARGAGLVEAEA